MGDVLIRAFSLHLERHQRYIARFFATNFLPPRLIVLPVFTLFRQLSIVDTRISLIIINPSLTLPCAIWMLKGFVEALPI